MDIVVAFLLSVGLGAVIILTAGIFEYMTKHTVAMGTATKLDIVLCIIALLFCVACCLFWLVMVLPVFSK